ncbi:MAG: 50S ribosomal protein L11 methyltransferase [Deltaproteobacteria bacterium]|nr:50S ribosomal protein L11 methyltransferase [Deltaproteobacteria bacterium]
MAQETWIEVRVIVPARMQEEASLFLTDFSGRGVIIEEENAPAGGVVVRAFFQPEDYGAWQRQEMQDYLKRLSNYDLYPLGLEVRQVAAEDWAEAWKAHFKPLKVTANLVLRPPWEEYAAQPGETVITIYPGMAFGTGRHASTLLCLRALEQVWEERPPQAGSPWQVLDVGTGTGILALTAARYGAEVLAIDLDPEAVAAALENVRLNNLMDRVWVEETPLTSLRQQFGLILANITAPDLLQLAEALTARLLSDGVLIISGFLAEDALRLSDRYQGLGLRQTGFLTQEDWGALIFRRP